MAALAGTPCADGVMATSLSDVPCGSGIASYNELCNSCIEGLENG